MKSTISRFLQQLRGNASRITLSMIILAATASFLRAEDDEPLPDMRSMSAKEITYLARTCPDITRVVSSGTVVAYGEIITPPILLARIRGAVFVNGIQVVPAQIRESDYRARKIADQICFQYILDSKSNIANADALVEHRLQKHKLAGDIDDFKIWKTTAGVAAIDTKSGSADGTSECSGLQALTRIKYNFILHALEFQFRIKEESEGRPRALNWFHARLEELHAMGIVEKYSWPEAAGRDAVAEIDFKDSFSGGFSLQDDAEDPVRIAYERRWKPLTRSLQAETYLMATHLSENEILIYSFAFKKAVAQDPALIHAFRAIRDGHNLSSNIEFVKQELSLTDDQGNALLEELR